MSSTDATRDDLQKKHDKELKELKAKNAEIVKAGFATKAERKDKLAEMQTQEDEMRSRHLEEMASLLTSGDEDIDYDELASLTAQTAIPVAAPSKEKSASKEPREHAKKVSKAQKRRDAKAEEERQRRERIEKSREVEELLGEKETETVRMKLLELRLESVDIPSDGNCMYNSVGHQLKARGRDGMTASLLRAMASNFMLENPDEFTPFMIDTDKDYETHCLHVATQQSLWGGQMEALALSRSLQLPLWIISAEQPTIRYGEEYQSHDTPLVLTFHRYLFALGKHYNSVKPLVVALQN